MIRLVAAENFKSLKRVDVPLGRLTILVGANAAGKSNILEAAMALRCLTSGMTASEVVFGRTQHLAEYAWRGIRGGLPEFAYDDTRRISLAGVVGSEKDELTYAAIFNALRGHPIPSLRGDMLWTVGGPSYASVRLPEKWEGPDMASGVVFHPLLIPHSDAIAVKGKLKTSNYDATRATLVQIPRRLKEDEALRDACTTFIDAFTSIRFLDLDPKTMRLPSPPGATRLGDRGENLSSVLQAILADPTKKEALLEWIRALTPMDARDLEIVVDVTGRTVAYLVEASGRRCSIFSASDGTLRFLGIAAALLGPDPATVYFIEELDTGIHPTRLHLLLELIEQACVHDGIQVVATTHNPALLAYLSPQARNDALLVYRPEGAPDTRVRRIAELPGIQDVLKRKDLGQLHASGWLENVAMFADADAANLVAEPGPGEGA